MTTPKFDYPSPTDRFVFVPCGKDDSEREEFWCPIFKAWMPPRDIDPTCSGCGIHWRKRVAVLEGWEIVPEGALTSFIPLSGEVQFYHAGAHAWHDKSNAVGQSLGEWRRQEPENYFVFIRRQSARPEAPDFWAKTIHGRADFYAISRTYEITDQNVGHALKKLLRCGRTHKTPALDIAEAIASLKRWQELEQNK